MCLSIPGKIVTIEGTKGIVDFNGIKKTVDLGFIKQPIIGEFVLVHVGFAIQRIREDVAKEAYRLLWETNKEELS